MTCLHLCVCMGSRVCYICWVQACADTFLSAHSSLNRETVTADRMTWLRTFLSLLGVLEYTVSGQVVCMWSFQVYCKAVYVIMYASTNVFGTTKQGLTFALSPYIPLVLASMGHTNAPFHNFFAVEPNRPPLSSLLGLFTHPIPGCWITMSSIFLFMKQMFWL